MSLIVGAEAGFVVSFSNLVVVIDHGHHFVAEPDVRVLLHLKGVAEQIKIIDWISITFNQVFQLVLHIVDTESSIDAGSFHGIKSLYTPAGYFSNEQEIFFPQTFGEFVNNGCEVTGRPVAHVFHGVDPITVEIGEGDPEFVDLAQRIESRRSLVAVRRCQAEIEILQIKEIAFAEFRIVIPVLNGAFTSEDG